MKKLIEISAAALLALSLSGAAFAQTGGNMNAPEPNASGTAIIQPGTTSTGVSTDSHRAPGTTGINSGSAVRPNNAELKGNNGNSAGGSNSSANTNNPTGMGNNAGRPMK